jgi:Holliday junction resolvase RusA-like endonuclease
MNFSIPIDPVPASRPRFTRSGHAYTAEPYRSFKDNLRELVAAQMVNTPVFDSPVVVDLFITCPEPKTTKLSHPKPDVDNYAKAVLDAMNGIVFKDDSLVVDLRVRKRWGASGEIKVSVKLD